MSVKVTLTKNVDIKTSTKYLWSLDSNTTFMKENSNSTRNIKHVNFVPKEVQRVLSSHKSIMNRKCSARRLFLNILQYSQENTFFNKNGGLQALSFIKKRPEHRCFLRTLRNF